MTRCARTDTNLSGAEGPLRRWSLWRQLAATTILFSATPFLLPEVVTEYGVRLGVAGLLSTAQVGAFALAIYVAGRTLHTHRRYLTVASVVLSLANLASALLPPFPVLMMLRIAAGAAAGLLVWLAWAKAMRVGGSMRNVAAAGPFAALIGAPVVGFLVDAWGMPGVFVLLGLVALPASYLRADFAGFKLQRSRMSPSRSNLVLVGALALVALAGSALFVYTGSLGRGLGLSTVAISAALSGNALAGLLSARMHNRGTAGMWILGIAVAVALVGFAPSAVFFILGLVLWGFCFWMAIPLILSAVADWSSAPEERVGDSQSAMAAGRALGPAVGGLVVGDGSFSTLTIVSVLGLMVASGVVFAVDRYRHGKTPPVAVVRSA